MTAKILDMPKKRGRPAKAESEVLERQIAVRWSADTLERIERVRKALGLDFSNFIRLIIAENLHVYEERAGLRDE